MTRREQENIQIRQGPSLDTYIPDVSISSEPPLIDFQKYSTILMRRRWVIIATALIVFFLGMAYTMTRKHIYESTAGVVVLTNSSVTPSSGDDIPLMNDLQGLTRSRSIDTQVELISSPDVASEAFSNLDASMRIDGFGSDSVPGWAYRVGTKKGTDIINVTGRAYTPEAAARLANTMVATYFSHDLKQNSQATRQARKYTEEQLDKTKKELAKANAELSKFKQSSGLISPTTQLNRMAEQMVQLSADYDRSSAEMAAAERQADSLREELSNESQDVASSTTVARNPRFDASLGRIDSLTSERARLLQEYTPQAREVKALDDQIKREEAQLKKVAQNVVTAKVQSRNPVHDTLLTDYATQVAAAAAASARASALQAALMARQDEAKSLPQAEQGYTDRMQKVTLLQHAFETLSSKYYALLLREQATIPSGMLVSKAEPAAAPSYPSVKSSGVFYLLFGLMLGIAMAVLAEWRDNRVHDQSATEGITHLSTLSVVPEVSTRSPQLLGKGGQHDGALLESFRILRNNILLSGAEDGMKLIAVTSPSRGDGKSTVAINLAVAMAMEKKKILLVDADMRRPSIHKYLNLSREHGLTTLITGKSNIDQAVQRVETENLFVLPAGTPPPNPPEMLNSAACRDMFKKLAEIYDAVVIDCPPATGLSDMQVISTIADGVVLVVSMNRTPKPHLQVTMRSLNQTGAPLIGMLLNRIDVNLKGCGYYDYCDSSQHMGTPKRQRREPKAVETKNV